MPMILKKIRFPHTKPHKATNNCDNQGFFIEARSSSNDGGTGSGNGTGNRTFYISRRIIILWPFFCHRVYYYHHHHLSLSVWLFVCRCIGETNTRTTCWHFSVILMSERYFAGFSGQRQECVVLFFCWQLFEARSWFHVHNSGTILSLDLDCLGLGLGFQSNPDIPIFCLVFIFSTMSILPPSIIRIWIWRNNNIFVQ